jgi:hypothetical protein
MNTSEILNCTQHFVTNEQIAAGVVEPRRDRKDLIKSLLTFDELPSGKVLSCRAKWIAELCLEEGYKNIMIGGAPFFMSHLESALKNLGMVPVYSFSKRFVDEVVLVDGSVEKKSIFKHIGFVEVK